MKTKKKFCFAGSDQIFFILVKIFISSRALGLHFNAVDITGEKAGCSQHGMVRKFQLIYIN